MGSALRQVESKPGFLSRVSVPFHGKVTLPSYGNIPTIVDWKTGAVSDGGAESLQLATYSLGDANLE